MISIRIYKDIPQGKLVVNFSYDTIKASPIVVYKRSTLRNMSIWEHKQSSAVILNYRKWRYREKYIWLKQI